MRMGSDEFRERCNHRKSLATNKDEFSGTTGDTNGRTFGATSTPCKRTRRTVRWGSSCPRLRIRMSASLREPRPYFDLTAASGQRLFRCPFHCSSLLGGRGL
jgi:hypothetical protein